MYFSLRGTKCLAFRSFYPYVTYANTEEKVANVRLLLIMRVSQLKMTDRSECSLLHAEFFI